MKSTHTNDRAFLMRTARAAGHSVNGAMTNDQLRALLGLTVYPRPRRATTGKGTDAAFRRGVRKAPAVRIGVA